MWTSRAARVAAASLAASATDLGVLSFSRRAGAAVWLAALLGCLAGGAANYAALRRKVFANRTAGVASSAVRYGLLVVLGGALLTSALVSLGVALGLPFMVARLGVAVVVVALWNYPISSRVVFKGGK